MGWAASLHAGLAWRGARGLQSLAPAHAAISSQLTRLALPLAMMQASLNPPFLTKEAEKFVLDGGWWVGMLGHAACGRAQLYCSSGMPTGRRMAPWTICTDRVAECLACWLERKPLGDASFGKTLSPGQVA